MEVYIIILIILLIAVVLGLGLGLGLGKKKKEKKVTTFINLLYSTDQINYQQSDSFSLVKIDDKHQASDPIFNNVFYGGNKWVAVGKPSGTSSAIYYSDNAINWTAAYDVIGQGNAVAYNGSSWVVVGDISSGTSSASSTIYYSDNAVSWTAAYDINGNIPFSNGGVDTGGNAVAYNGSSWVAVGDISSGASSAIYYSDNAVSWTPAYDVNGNVPFGDDGVGNAVTYNGISWVAVGQGDITSSAIYYSDNAVSWTAAYDINGNIPFSNGGVDTGGNAVAYNGSSWVAVGYMSSGASSAIYYSDNAVSWTPAYDVNGNVPFGLNGQGNAIAYNGTSWVTVGQGFASSSIYYSDNTVSWTPAYDVNGNVPFGDNGAGNVIIYTGSYWIAGGVADSANTPVLYYSDNAVSWTPASYRNVLPESEEYADGITGLCFADNKVVAVGGYIPI